MKKFYAIGEVSKIMGVSVQALRYYAKIKLLEPEYISPRTGYRYYTYDQFHFIDRIKYGSIINVGVLWTLLFTRPLVYIK